MNVVVTSSVQCMCIVHACVHCAYVRLSGFVLAITCIFMHGFQNNLVQFSVIRKSVISNIRGMLNVKVTFEGQMIKKS